MGLQIVRFLYLLVKFALRFLPTQKANNIEYVIKKCEIFKEGIVKHEHFEEDCRHARCENIY